VTPEKNAWITAFLVALAESGNVARSCKKAKVSRQEAYRTRKEDKDFLMAWDEALGIAVGLLEDEAWRRAREGVLEPEFYKGEKVGAVRKYSDTLLIFLLKAHKPFLYRENIDITSGGEKLESDDSIRQDILRQLSRIADTSTAAGVSSEPDAGAA
jgi:hypothetical protein